MPVKVDEKEYRLEFFKEQGFIRKKCRVCGSYFWTLNPNQEHCNDVPCTLYSFWRVKRFKPLSVREARRKFIEFFNGHGHGVVEPRPVVARWREDLYLTIASIVVFQPHVTSGLVPPPANPLVIVQPCIRLEDIDNVGITFGRHLTSFEMGGHHAFNYPDKHVYWKNETVKLAYEFFTREIGIPPEELTFKESWWEGGGNAGPSFEVTVGGLELATLVFMQYRVVDGKYEPMELKVVDTGYGIERIAWFTQRTPTAFHAVYGDLLRKYHEVLGIDPLPDDVLYKLAELAGRLDPDDPRSLREFYASSARVLGTSVDEAVKILQRQAWVYALLDHARTLALMLGDGVVPSNSGEGYLARLVARRALRILSRLGANQVKLVDLVDEQVKYWGNDFPSIRENRDYILDAISVEEERYRQAISRGVRLVERIIKRKKSITVNDLIEIYDSHGVAPDIVSEIASKHGIRIEIPHNFYSLVALRHGGRGVVVKKTEKVELPREIVEWASKLPETRRLFHEDPYLREFNARIVAARDRYVVLDQTAFYPRGGGQDYDTGVLRICGDEYKVVAVWKIGKVIVHVLDKPLRAKCDEVHGVIDWDRRFKLMRHHTAVHIVLAAARKVLGNHVWQAGAEKTIDKARLDITHHKPLTLEEVKRIEDLANKIVDERLTVKTTFMDRNTAEKIHGYKLYQGGVPMEPIIRVVEIPGWDAEACFGTHVSNTAEVGAIKIVNVERIQDGVVRLELVAGTNVSRSYGELEETLEETAKLIGASSRDILVRVKKLIEEDKERSQLLQRYRVLVKKLILDKLVKESRKICDITIYTYVDEIGDEKLFRDIAKEITSKEKTILIAVREVKGGSIFEVDSSSDVAVKVDLRRLVRKLREEGVKAGGKQDHISGRIGEEPRKALEKLLDSVKELVLETCG